MHAGIEGSTPWRSVALCSARGMGPPRHGPGTGRRVESLLNQEERRAVKRTILLVVGCAALAALAYSATRLTAQVGGPAAPQVTKVGVVNVGTVFSKYTKALLLKEELQKSFKPFKDKA